MTIILCLDEILEEQGVSVSELAQEVGITRANMSNIKTGNVRAIRFSTLDKICDALGCEPGDIIKHEKPESPGRLEGFSHSGSLASEEPDGPSPLPAEGHENLLGEPSPPSAQPANRGRKQKRVKVRAR